MLTRRNFRFSLLSLLLLTTLAAVSLSHWLASRELKQSRAMVSEQRRMIRVLSHRLGFLTEEDLAHIQVLRVLTEPDSSVPLGERQRWMDVAWHIHLPKGKKWRLRWASRNIPKDGLPEESAGYKDLRPEDGDAMWTPLRISFPHNRILGWGVEFAFGGQEGEMWHYWIPADESQWLEVEGHSSGYRAGPWDHHTGECIIEQFSCDEPVVLFIERQSLLLEKGPAFTSFTTDPNPCPGFMVWLEATGDLDPPAPVAAPR